MDESIMVPQDIQEALQRQPGMTDQPSSSDAEVILAKLGASRGSEMHNFYMCHDTGSILLLDGRNEVLELESIAMATSFGRDVYEVPSDMICLTSGEGEGFYLVSNTDGKVYDYGVTQHDALARGELQPRWPSFFAFVRWYLGITE